MLAAELPCEIEEVRRVDVELVRVGYVRFAVDTEFLGKHKKVVRLTSAREVERFLAADFSGNN